MRDLAPIHPGLYLQQECATRNLTSHDLAQLLACDETLLKRILSGQSILPVDLAHTLQKKLGIPLGLLMHLQKDFDALNKEQR